MYDYESSTHPSVSTASRVVLKKLSSDTSAGPLALDQSANRLYFVDQSPVTPYIGYLSLDTTYNSNLLLTINYEIFGFTFDARHNQRYYHTHSRTCLFLSTVTHHSVHYRRLYWTVPNVYDSTDGVIYYMDVDATTPTAVSLQAAIGASRIRDPMGIAVHPYTNLIYWIDKDSSSESSSLRSCNLDGTGYSEVLLYRKAQNSSLGKLLITQ